MSAFKTGGFGLRSQIEALLRSDTFCSQLLQGTRFSPRQVINPLLSFLYSGEELIKWRAVSAVGFVMAKIADEDMEAARIIMRRLIWSLNDESGGIGWGSPEAMGEIMACHEKLAAEYAHLLLCYIIPDGNPLDHALLERGVLWGLGRIAQQRPFLFQDAAPCLFPYLKSSDPLHRGLATWTLGFLKSRDSLEPLEPLRSDRTRIRIFENGELVDFCIGDLAQRAIDAVLNTEAP